MHCDWQSAHPVQLGDWQTTVAHCAVQIGSVLPWQRQVA
jgi:hypothetical protein